MTNREFYTAITANEMISEELREFAAQQIEKMDARNATRSSKESKTQAENRVLKEEILTKWEENHQYLAAEVAVKHEISVQKASALLRQMTEDGILKCEEIKVPKKGKQKAYTKI